MCLWCPIMKRKEIITWILVYPNRQKTLILKNGGKWSYSYETKASIRLSQWGEWISGARSLKEERLLCESMFMLIERWTLILKLVERVAFLLRPKR